MISKFLGVLVSIPLALAVASPLAAEEAAKAAGTEATQEPISLSDVAKKLDLTEIVTTILVLEFAKEAVRKAKSRNSSN